MQEPREFQEAFLAKLFGSGHAHLMVNGRPDSNEAVAKRLQTLRQMVAGGNQTTLATKLGVTVKRWNNFERGSPLSKEVAIMIAKKFPGITTDWLFLGIASGVPMALQRELERAASDITPAARSRAG